MVKRQTLCHMHVTTVKKLENGNEAVEEQLTMHRDGEA